MPHKEESQAPLRSVIAEANAALELGEHEKVLRTCRGALGKYGKSHELHALCGWALLRMSELQLARHYFLRALDLCETFAHSHAGLALTHVLSDELEPALRHYRRAYELMPNDDGIRFNFACALRASGFLFEAIDQFFKLVQSNPTHIEAYRNLGIAFSELGRWRETIQCCRAALDIDSDSTGIKSLYAHAQLATGNFREGWREYESRIESDSHGESVGGLPLWKGPGDNRQSIAVIGEQGVGTEIMFAACLTDLLEHIPSITFVCDPRLVRLLQYSFPKINVIPKQNFAGLRSRGLFDCCVMAGSLPLYFRNEVCDFPSAPYLKPRPDTSRKWLARLSRIGPGLKVGFSWRGGVAGASPFVRRTSILDWRSLFNTSGVDWINLQYDSTSVEISQWQAMFPRGIHGWEDLDLRSNFDDMSGLISQLDLIISVPNSTVHLAGALGSRVWVALPVASDWRWTIGESTSPWHPTATMFRQKQIGTWDEVFDAISRRLAELIAVNPKRMAA